MKCKYCGAENDSNAMFCQSCGYQLSQTADVATAKNTVNEKNTKDMPAYGKPASEKAPAAEAYSKEDLQPESTSATSKGLGIASMCCAIAAPFLTAFTSCCCLGIPGEIVFIVALVLGIVSNKKAKKCGQKKNGFAKAGIIISSVILAIQLIVALIPILDSYLF
ncbi:MAG: zinc-ribbon domain-containing protein [Clostridia bacterium]|nr:zinc-ribbon domain-containing protein [Clostridia bacterium]